MSNNRRPFWLPASNYYVLSIAVAAAFFFVVWGILHDGGDETPWITAGLSASVLVCGAVILREVILRRADRRFLLQQQAMERRLRAAPVRPSVTHHSNKLTIERNAAIMHEIRQKSDAANLLNKFSAGHREVFEICAEYISLNESELKLVNPNSPRLAPLLKSRSKAAEYHRHHMLRWAEIESKTLTNSARDLAKAVDKVAAAQNALVVVESALRSYPSEETLLQSRDILRDLVVSINVSDWVERAERAAFKGNYTEAVGLYQDALFYLGRDGVRSDVRDEAARRINDEMLHLRGFENEADS